MNYLSSGELEFFHQHIIVTHSKSKLSVVISFCSQKAAKLDTFPTNPMAFLTGRFFMHQFQWWLDFHRFGSALRFWFWIKLVPCTQFIYTWSLKMKNTSYHRNIHIIYKLQLAYLTKFCIGCVFFLFGTRTWFSAFSQTWDAPPAAPQPMSLPSWQVQAFVLRRFSMIILIPHESILIHPNLYKF